MGTTSGAGSLPDLDITDVAGQWQRFCSLLWHNEALGMWLDVSRMQLNKKQLDQLEQPFTKAFEAMNALEAGAIANKDENRQVGHYWLRNAALAPNAETTTHINSEIERMQRFGAELLEGKIKAPNGSCFTNVLWIGIGGSALGPVLMIRALQEHGKGLPFHFLDNVDPDGMSRLFNAIGEELQTTLVVVVSKSGGTPEPHIGMVQARHRLEMHGCNWSGQAVAITMDSSKLDQEAVDQKWLNRFDMFDWVGGRTSITSAVGILPAILAGIDSSAFLAGAAEMDALTRIPILLQNPAALMAASWYVAGEGKGKRDMVVLPYRDRLEVFSRYLQQLVMESIGKRLDRQGEVVHQGIAVYGNKGSTDQHAYVQQLRDGIDNFFATFIEVLEDPTDIPMLEDSLPGDFLDGFLQGTRAALSEGGRQSITITLEKFNPKNLGVLVALFERAVGLYGELVDINAYHQPGVEAGKKAAAEILSLQKQVESLMRDGTERSIEQIALELSNANANASEAIFFILRHLCGNSRGLTAIGNWSEPESLRFQKN
ncbi:glucose-6-phosphate isomerase [Synechococcus sp.]